MNHDNFYWGALKVDNGREFCGKPQSP